MVLCRRSRVGWGQNETRRHLLGQYDFSEGEERPGDANRREITLQQQAEVDCSQPRAPRAVLLHACMHRVSTLLRKARRDAGLSLICRLMKPCECRACAAWCVQCPCVPTWRSLLPLVSLGLVYGCRRAWYCIFRGNGFFASGKLYRGNHKYLPCGLVTLKSFKSSPSPTYIAHQNRPTERAPRNIFIM